MTKPTEIPAPANLDHLVRDARGYPIIATVSRDGSTVDFGSISERRKLALAVFDWCAVCGRPFGDQDRWQVLLEEIREDMDVSSGGFGEAPVHEICGLYAAQVCPYLSSPYARLGDEERRGRRREALVRFMGFKRTSSVEAFESGLQRGERVLHFAHTELVGEFSYREPTELSERYETLLQSERPLEVSPAEQELISLFAENSDAGGAVAGAALVAGGAFAPDIFKVAGLSVFDHKLYIRMALSVLRDAESRKDMAENFGDASIQAVARWLMERGDEFPEVLSGWRDMGSKLVLSKTGRTPPAPRPQGPGRAVSKNASCPCGSGRKARRCHPAGVSE
ncbi:SEC-C metal-binding domain-containing protein [Actinomadura adrarensis]|uniref:SEC-C metal-binding domain-containing protein n=1 Tax=Actinomadura adrarensis TaxID=1819600 RepID=A0ABW3CRW0_9ACTN